MFCQFSTVQQDDPVTHTHVHTFFSHMILLHRKGLDIVRRATQRDLMAYPLQRQEFASINPKFPVPPPPPSPTLPRQPQVCSPSP